MKLQFNDSGAWRQVMNFPSEHLRKVQAAACQLAGITGSAKMRILNDDESVYAYCVRPESGLWDVK